MSAIAPRKNFYLTRIWNPPWAFRQVLRWTVHIALSLQWWLKSADCFSSKIWTIICYNLEIVWDRISAFITTTKLWSRIQAFDWYWHRWPWMTLNGMIAHMLRYFTIFDSFGGQSRHNSPPVCRIPVSSSTICQNWPTLQRSLCDSWATCVHQMYPWYSLCIVGCNCDTVYRFVVF